jgi:RimJ/RimL family protein N-acetyltransferase
MRGAIPSLEAFVGLLYQQVDAQFVVIRRDGGDRIGLVQLFGYQHRDGVGQLSAFFDPPAHRAGWPLEAMFVFANYCFISWPIRKLYLESPEPVFETYASGSPSLFEVEGRLKNHEFYEGEFVDRVIAAIYRETWQSNSAILQRLIGPARGMDNA